MSKIKKTIRFLDSQRGLIPDRIVDDELKKLECFYKKKYRKQKVHMQNLRDIDNTGRYGGKK